MNPKANKYYAKAVWFEGERYHSQAELDFRGVQELLLRAGEIVSYEHHPPPVVLLNGREKWKVDYYVVKSIEPDIRYYVEVKGYPTPDFKRKFNHYKNEADKHLSLFTVKQNRGSQTSFSIMEEYCVNPHNIEMA